MTYRGPWNAASLRHRQAPRKYKAVGPVGDASNRNAPECPGCRMCVCSCPPKSQDIKRISGNQITMKVGADIKAGQLVGIVSGISAGHTVSVNYDKVADEVFKRLTDAIHAGMMTLPVNSKLATNLINGLGACCRPAPTMLEGTPLKVGDRLVHPDTGDDVYTVSELVSATFAKLTRDHRTYTCSLALYTRVRGPLSAEYLDRVDGAIKSDGRESARSASSGLTGKGEGTKTTTSSSMGLCKTPDEAGKNQTPVPQPGQTPLMFEGRPLRVGDVLRAVGPEVSRSHVDTKWVVSKVYRIAAELTPAPNQARFLRTWLTDRFEHFTRDYSHVGPNQL